MRIVFRADASTRIGSGHVMRCATLAQTLAAAGAQPEFVCREHRGHLCDYLAAQGFTVHRLPASAQALRRTPGEPDTSSPAHLNWLGSTQKEDAQQAIEYLGPEPIDWLVVDHYALDACWHQELRPLAKRILVIDDLADRRHDCDLLLDSALGREPADYAGLVPPSACILTGPDYALLRPAFAAKRPEALRRRAERAGQVERIFVSFGAVDPDNYTLTALHAILAAALRLSVDVLLGSTAPHLSSLCAEAERLGPHISIHIDRDAGSVAELMSQSDLAIGAVGGMTWERCCLGLPSIVLVIAENQRFAAQQLDHYGACLVADRRPQIEDAVSKLQSLQSVLADMSQKAAGICDGNGSARVAKEIFEAL